MFAPDVRFDGWSTNDWSRLFHIVNPSPALAAEERGGIVLVFENDRLRKVIHTRLGRLECSSVTWPQSLEALAQQFRVRWVLASHSGALEEAMERWGARIQPTDDLLAQSLLLGQAIKELISEGGIRLWPATFSKWPLPSYQVAHRSLGTICPLGKSSVFGIFEEGELWTCLVLRRQEQGVDWILGPEMLRQQIGLLSGDFRRDYRHLLDTVHAHVAPVALGMFAERSVWQELLINASPGSWARAVAVRDVIVEPAVGMLAFPLGIDALRGAVALAQDFLVKREWPNNLPATLGGVFSMLERWFRPETTDAQKPSIPEE
jgi:hypothetical protein